MYMSIKMDEDEKNVEMGIGMKFNSIGELKNIQDKIKKAQSLNNQSGRIDAMKNDSPLSKFTGNENEKVAYNYNESGFTRVTTVPEPTEEEAKEMETLFSESNDADNEFIQYFEESYYTVKLVFPKPLDIAVKFYE